MLMLSILFFSSSCFFPPLLIETCPPNQNQSPPTTAHRCSCSTFLNNVSASCGSLLYCFLCNNAYFSIQSAVSTSWAVFASHFLPLQGVAWWHQFFSGFGFVRTVLMANPKVLKVLHESLVDCGWTSVENQQSFFIMM